MEVYIENHSLLYKFMLCNYPVSDIDHIPPTFISRPILLGQWDPYNLDLLKICSKSATTVSQIDLTMDL